ncbi:uncharacterized protein K444DRAFT_257261 [Hyaloscypha bicolor E]|uniref:Uncharacterized protein n=1 Tax=Hyaloscypha bicolor E TaxID=1095630 RepID=A0A2J6SNF8_9HELO|nr:uncharacterized protein K444DRAFT_257261 [Hyaloscypha bicolor E]PMD52250.1 hypothetical protein K444DRAFT_257261 [Hyaloscypha bicolor E]
MKGLVLLAMAPTQAQIGAKHITGNLLITTSFPSGRGAYYCYNATIHHTHSRGAYRHCSLLWNGNALEGPCMNAITHGSSACQNLPPSSILRIPRSDVPQTSKSSSILNLGMEH